MRYSSLVGAALFYTSVAYAAGYPAMAPQDQYMMDPAAEVALAKSAAPPSIADKATVLVLTRHGYETAVKGSNGFVCAIERGWMLDEDFDAGADDGRRCARQGDCDEEGRDASHTFRDMLRLAA